jgi:hypothetical protein
MERLSFSLYCSPSSGAEKQDEPARMTGTAALRVEMWMSTVIGLRLRAPEVARFTRKNSGRSREMSTQRAKTVYARKRVVGNNEGTTVGSLEERKRFRTVSKVAAIRQG